MKVYSILLYVLLGLGVVSCTPENTDTYERFFLKSNGADLAVEVNGNIASKTFILLLHGGPGGSGFEYNTGAFTEEIEKDYAVAYLDQRGQGASQGNYTSEEVTLQQFGDDVYALARFLKQKYGEDISLFLMGHSWGGTTGTSALINTDVQAELNGWLEVDGAHDIPLLNKEAIKMFIEIGNQELAAGNNVDRWTEIVEFAEGVDINNIKVDEGGQINGYGFEAEGLIEAVTEGGFGTPSHGLFTSPITSLASVFSGQSTATAILSETEAAAMTDRLDEITIPCVFLWGQYDFVVPPALAESALERVSSTEKHLVLFEHSGHSPMDNEADLFVEEVRTFIERYK